MRETVVGEIAGVEMCCLDEVPPSRGGMPVFGVGSDAVLPELIGRKVVEDVVEDVARGRGVCVEIDGCGGGEKNHDLQGWCCVPIAYVSLLYKW